MRIHRHALKKSSDTTARAVYEPHNGRKERNYHRREGGGIRQVQSREAALDNFHRSRDKCAAS